MSNATGMLQYIAKRLLLTIPTIVAITLLVFLMLHAVPGDPATIFAGDKNVPHLNSLAVVRRDMGLDRPLTVQYLDYPDTASDRETSDDHCTRRVSREPRDRAADAVVRTNWPWPRSCWPSPSGWSSGSSRRCGVQRGSMRARCSSPSLGVSMPIFWLASMLIFVFAITLGWFPAIGHRADGTGWCCRRWRWA